MAVNSMPTPARIDEGLSKLKSLLQAAVPRRDLVKLLEEYPEVFGDPEEYIKYLFQVGILDAKRSGGTYEVFAA